MAKIEVELADGSKAGDTLKSLQKEAGKLRKELAGLPKESDEFVKKAKRLNEVSDGMKDIQDEIKGTVSASDTLKNAWNKLPGAQFFNGIADSFSGFKKGVGGLITEFGMLKTAIAATGIGLLVLVLGSLVSWLTTTQEGMDKLTSVTRPLKAIFEALKGVLQDMGGKVFKQLEAAIKNPIQALKDLGNILLENVINRFKAFALMGPAIKKIISGDLSGGFKDLGNAVLQVGTGVTNLIDKVVDAGKAIIKVVDEAATKGSRLNQLQIMIEKAEIRQITRSKQIELALKQQKDIVEDSTKSWDARREAARKALDLQNKGLNAELSLLDMRIEKMRLEQSLNDTSREQEKELAELQAARLQLQATVTEQSIEWKKKIIEFDMAQAAEQLAILRNTEDLRLQIMAESRDRDIAAIKTDTERKIKDLIGNEQQITEQRLLLLESERQQIAAANKDWDEKEAELERQRIENELKLIEDYYSDVQLLQLEALANKQITAEEYGEEMHAIQVMQLEDQLAMLEANGQQQSEAYKQIYAELLQLNLDYNNQVEQRDFERFNATISGASNLAGALAANWQADIDQQQARLDRIKEMHGEESEAYKNAELQMAKTRKDLGNKKKKAERAEVGLNLITELSSIWKGAATLGPILGPILGVALSAAAILRSQAALKNIESQQFYGGGYTGSGGKYDPAGVVHKGEVVWSQDDVRLFGGVQAVESIRPTALPGYATGGPVNPFVDRSRAPIPSAAMQNSSGASSQNDSLLREQIAETRGMRQDLAAYKKAIDARFDRIQVTNSLQDMKKGFNTLDKIITEADI